MVPQTTPLVLGPVGSQGFSSTLSPQGEAWVMLALFGVGFIGLMIWGFIGGNLDVRASGGAGAA